MAISSRDLLPLIAAVDRMSTQFASTTGTTLPGSATGFESPSGGKSIHKLMEEQTELLAENNKALRSNKDGMVQHARSLESFGVIMAAVAPAIQQYAKYNITRPYEMLGGTPGQVGRGMLEREKDVGDLVTGAMAVIAGAVTGSTMVAGAVMGAGQLGVSRWIGRNFFNKEAVEGAGLQTVAQMTQEQIPQFRQAAMIKYGLEKQGAAMGGMGAGSARGWAESFTALGLTGSDSTEVIARAIQAGGALGFKRLSDAGGADAITEMVNQGIYGTDAGAIASALASGMRVGATRGDLEAASRRTGLQLGDSAQAYTSIRAATFLGGEDVTRRLFTQATGTSISREFGGSFAAQQMGAIAGAATSATEGNEATEMLMYRQFREANPGSTYLDFVEARRNKETDPKWLRTIQGAASNFGAMGQAGRIAGASIMGTRPMFLAGAGDLAGQFLEEGGQGEITQPGMVGLSISERRLKMSDFTATMEIVGKVEEKYGERIKDVTDKINAAALASNGFIVYLETMAKIMDDLSRSAGGIAAEDWSDRNKKRITQSTGGASHHGKDGDW